MLTKRSMLILETGIRDFIETGHPVTSEYLYDRHDFGIKPAMIRWELRDLTEAGYFYQRHISGGRVPSDKGYRFFVRIIMDNIGDNIFDFSDFLRNLNKAVGFLQDGEERDFVRQVSEALELLSVCYDAGKDSFYGSGLDELLKNLQSYERDCVVRIAEDFETMPERLRVMRDLWEEWEEEFPQVFVGKSPITKSPDLSVMVSRIVGREGPVIVAVLGPKRIDYEKPMRFLAGLRKVCLERDQS